MTYVRKWAICALIAAICLEILAYNRKRAALMSEGAVITFVATTLSVKSAYNIGFLPFLFSFLFCLLMFLLVLLHIWLSCSLVHLPWYILLENFHTDYIC